MTVNSPAAEEFEKSTKIASSHIARYHRAPKDEERRREPKRRRVYNIL